MLCRSCQFENPTGVKFCGACGAALIDTCAHCGAENPPGFKFCGECGASLSLEEPAAAPSTLDAKLDHLQRYFPRYLADKILANRGRLEGERKIVTVLFADIVNYTEISERLGEDALFGLMDSLYEALIHGVHRYEGTVNKLTGDGLLALFGAPLAVEDAPQRAVLAALQIQREAERFGRKLEREHGPALRIRIGINTGPVVVGTISNDLRMEYEAVGDTVNLAKRMEQIAEPGAIYITDETNRQVERQFRCKDLGFHDVKGKSDKVRVWRVLRQRGLRGRGEAETDRAFTRFVGRDRELELLRDALERAESGRGQVVSIIADAGHGKTRLLYEFRKYIPADAATFLEGHSAPYGASAAYLPIVDLLKRAFDVRAGDDESRIRRKVDTALARMGADAAETAPYLLHLLMPGAGETVSADMPPEVLKRNTFEALRRLILDGSAARPLVVAIENLHWTDKTSVELVEFLIESISAARVLLVLTYRPDFVATGFRKSYHGAISLPRLSNRESLEIVSSLLDDAAIEDDFAELILERCDGVPFFIEELVKSLRESGAIEQRENRWTITDTVTDLHTPNSVHEVLAARIDRLPDDAKRLLQMGSVMGRTFSWSLIKEVSGLPDMELVLQLSALKNAELLFERGIHPDSTYIFKHAFTQDVAYEGLLEQAKRRLHQQIAEAVLVRHGDDDEAWVGMLAHHFARGGDEERALRYLMRSGERSRRVHANDEAVQSFTGALEIVRGTPETPETRRRRVELILTLGALQMLLGYYAETLPLYAEALEIAEGDGDLVAVAHLKTRIGRVHYMHGDNEAAIECYQEGLKLAEGARDKTRMAILCQNLGDVHFTGGSLPMAIETYTNALEISEELDKPRNVAAAYTALSNAYCRAGDPATAMAWGRKALALGERMGDERRIAWACVMLAQASSSVGYGDATQMEPYLRRAQQIFEKVGDYRGTSWTKVYQAEQAVLAGEFEKAVVLRDEATNMGTRSGGFQHEVSAQLAKVAEELTHLGRYREAFECCQRSLAIALKVSNKLEYGYAYAVLAEIHATEEYRDWDKATWHFEESLKAFREVGAELNVARAYLAGARIAVARGDGKAREFAEKARDIAVPRQAKWYVQQAEELLAKLA